MANQKIDISADGAEMVNLANQMAEDYRQIASQITKFESEIIPSIEKCWQGEAGKAFIFELKNDFDILTNYQNTLGTLLATLMLCGNRYKMTENNAVQHVAALK